MLGSTDTVSEPITRLHFEPDSAKIGLSAFIRDLVFTLSRRMLVRVIYSDVITVSVWVGHFVGVACAPTRRSLRTHWYRCLLWVLGSDVIDCVVDWRAVSNSAYSESVIGRKWLSISVVGACICCGCMCYSQDNTTDLHLIALKVKFANRISCDL